MKKNKRCVVKAIALFTIVLFSSSAAISANQTSRDEILSDDIEYLENIALEDSIEEEACYKCEFIELLILLNINIFNQGNLDPLMTPQWNYYEECRKKGHSRLTCFLSMVAWTWPNYGPVPY